MSDFSKKRKKKFYGGGFSKKSKYALNLSPGLRGFLCTHNGHPKFCIRELYNILDEFAQPPSKQDSSDENKGDETTTEDDFEAELKKDIENAQNESKSKEFQVVETGVTGCVFVKTASYDPGEIMDKIIQRIVDSRQCQSRKILRMLPIQVTCKAYIEDIKKAAVALFDKYFKGDARTYAIVINRRNNSNILRDELLSSLGLMIRDRNPYHSTDLKKPQLTVLVEVLKSICCLAVISDYYKHKKYNLVEIGLASQNSMSTNSLDSSVPDTTVNSSQKDHLHKTDEILNEAQANGCKSEKDKDDADCQKKDEVSDQTQLDPESQEEKILPV